MKLKNASLVLLLLIAALLPRPVVAVEAESMEQALEIAGKQGRMIILDFTIPN